MEHAEGKQERSGSSLKDAKGKLQGSLGICVHW